ncbi:LexA family transcriptional regulator [Propionigenium maris DSM 9537]|uniref:LexA family transcriptional regulator n=1 Tax=Propionigenium maris DSM 9537 TaxID=1123000 RepID=A0A9W6GPH4_9FUSO|nr:XRE family transcriptional regulator [Propionigenium maris]GLI58312.1 LexA family transcriptional regulator [Propionigenium maris DSM 9537]
MTIGEFLKEERKKAGFSLRGLAIKIGISHSAVADIERGTTQKRETIEKIMEGLSFTQEKKEEALELLIFDELPDHIKKLILKSKNNTTPSNINSKLDLEEVSVINLPVYGQASAGSGKINLGNILRYERLTLFPDQNIPENAFGVEVSGDSMYPTLLDGDLAIIDPQCQDINLNGEICVLTYEGEEYIKRVKFTDRFVTLISDNPDRETYKDIIVLKDEFSDFKCHGILIQSWRRHRSKKI